MGGAGASAGLAAAVQAASEQELQDTLGALGEGPIQRLKVAFTADKAGRGEGNLLMDVDNIAATEAAIETLTVRSVSGDVIALLPNARLDMTVAEVLQQLRAASPPPKGSIYGLIVGDMRLRSERTLLECHVELNGEVTGVAITCVINPETQTKREEALQVVRDGPQGFGSVAYNEAMAMGKPPQRMMKVVRAVCCLLEIPPLDSGTEPDFWQPCKETFPNHEAWIAKLEGFKPELVEDTVGNAEAALARVATSIEDPDFRPEVVRNTALAFADICNWVLVQVQALRELAGDG